MMQSRRVFSLDEARELLPTLTPLVEELRDCKRTVDEFRHLAGVVAARARTNGHADESAITRAQARAERAADTMNRLLSKTRSLGVEVKDLTMGLVDFPYEMDGRVVYLCWRLGEPDIAYWHEVHTGFFARQRL